MIHQVEAILTLGPPLRRLLTNFIHCSTYHDSNHSSISVCHRVLFFANFLNRQTFGPYDTSHMPRELHVLSNEYDGIPSELVISHCSTPLV